MLTSQNHVCVTSQKSGGGEREEFPLGNSKEEMQHSCQEPPPEMVLKEEKGDEGLQCIPINTNASPLLAKVVGRLAKRAWAAVARDDR